MSFGPQAARLCLPLHVISGCDTVSGLAGPNHGKRGFWATFSKVAKGVQAGDVPALAIASAMEALGTPQFLTEEGGPEDAASRRVNPTHWKALERMFVQVYTTAQTPPGANTLQALRVFMWPLCGVTKISLLPPTPHCFNLHLLRAHWQMMVWTASLLAPGSFPNPDGLGWEFRDEAWRPVWSKQPVIPQEAALHRCSCACTTGCTTRRCSCVKKGVDCDGRRCRCSGCTNRGESTLNDELQAEDESRVFGAEEEGGFPDTVSDDDSDDEDVDED